MRPFLLIGFLVALQGISHAGDEWLEKLHSPDIAARRAAIGGIQTLDDPRIPEACLPLLADKGNSIRRLAARAIGSRFDRIPSGRVKDYVAALKKCADTTDQGIAKAMCERAIGLLLRNYSSDQFSVSPDGRWVLYEQRRLPVIADTRSQSHALLSPVVAPDHFYADTIIVDGNVEKYEPPRQTGLLKLMMTNAPVADLFEPAWHPKSEAVAFSPYVQWRFFHPISIWRASDGECRTFDTHGALLPLLPKGWPHWSTTIEFVKWDGPCAVLHVYDCDPAAGDIAYDPVGVQIAVDIRTWKMSVVR
jgi:hypothetical protein